MKKLKSYDESKKFEKLENEAKKKFWFFEFFDKFHNIIMHTHNFVDCTIEFSVLTSRMISLDNQTRWNSWHSSLVVTDKHALSIDIYIKNHLADLSENYLTLQN